MSTSIWGGDDPSVAWNENAWASNTITTSLTGQSLTSSIGSITTSEEINKGWGQDGWGVENWGESGLTVEITAPDGLTASLPNVNWGYQTLGEDGWGGIFYLNPADVVGLSGLSLTASVPTQLDIPEQIEGLGLTSSVGAITPTEFVVGLTGQGATSAVGSIAC